jgi:hypothetical protein
LLDVTGAPDALPTLPLDANPQAEHERLTGTYAVGALAPTLAPTADKSDKSLPCAGKTADKVELAGDTGDAVTSMPSHNCHLLTIAVMLINGRGEWI